MSEQLSEHEREATLRVARAMREHAWSAGEALYESVGAVRTIRTLTIVALAIRQAEYITDQLREGSIPSGHAVWNGRDPGGPAPGADDAPQLAEQSATS